MGKKKPSGVKGDPNYDQDYDPNHAYHDEWQGLVYEKELEDKMKNVMDTAMPAQAQLFASDKTYLYYTRYYSMLNRMDEIRRENVLANINKSVVDPLKYKDRFKAGAKNFGLVNTTLGVAGIAGVIYALRFIKG
mmetsp:Transcript_44462/g.71214  ORF Transcript_44462/g.71214 Transcript_44462/m.71214 type:complete len:134 (+) Transcript_44462:74-475(+)